MVKKISLNKIPDKGKRIGFSVKRWGKRWRAHFYYENEVRDYWLTASSLRRLRRFGSSVCTGRMVHFC